jgi:membrane protein YqaA with SNARE-associated domain
MSPEGHVQGIAQHIVEFVRANEMWAAPIVGVLAFGESLAFISVALPAWAVLVALGALISQGGISFWPVWVAGAVGAGLGDWLSYWIGTKLGSAVGDIWPLSRHPDLIPRRERFVTKWGALAIFIGRFFRPSTCGSASRGRHLCNAILAFPNCQFRFRFRMGGDAAHTGGCCGKEFQINMAVNLRFSTALSERLRISN